MIYVEQLTVVVVEVRARLRMQTARTHTLAADCKVFAAHSIHVCRRASQVRDISFEAIHTNHLSDFTQNRVFAARGYEFALVG